MLALIQWTAQFLVGTFPAWWPYLSFVSGFAP